MLAFYGMSCIFYCVMQNSDAVFNLVNGIDVEETKNAMEQYKNTNSELIRKNKIKLVSVYVLYVFKILIYYLMHGL